MYMNTPVSHIVAVDLEGAIGKGNKIPWRCKKDLEYFKEKTINKVCIMGRSTFESLPAVLKSRTVIVVTNQPIELMGSITQHDDHHVRHSIGDALKLAANLSMGREIMICGGSQIYHQTSPWMDRVYMSVINTTVEDPDTYYNVPITMLEQQPEIILEKFEVD